MLPGARTLGKWPEAFTFPSVNGAVESDARFVGSMDALHGPRQGERFLEIHSLGWAIGVDGGIVPEPYVYNP